MSVKRVPQGMLLDHRTAGCGFRITIKHDLCARTAPSVLVIPSARNDIPRKWEREVLQTRRGATPSHGQRSAAHRRANYAEQAATFFVYHRNA